MFGAFQNFGRLGALSRAIAAAWSPSALYAAGQVGAWYDPSDLSTMFTDAAGTTPVVQPGTVADQPVGLILDKSGGSHHASQPTSTARPLLSARKNWLVGTETLATQSVTVTATQCVLSFYGTGTITLSGVSTAGPLVGTGATDRVSLAFTPTAGVLTLTVSGSVTQAQLEVGSTATEYQRVTSASDYDASAGQYYLKFDGVDDYLSTAAIDLTGTSKVLAISGTLANDGASSTIVYETSTNAAGGGAFFGATKNEGPDNLGSFVASGSSFSINNLTTTPPALAVTTAQFSSVFTAGVGAATVNVNGVAQTMAVDYADNSSGNFGNHSLFFGGSSGGLVPFNGNIYSLIIAGALYDAATVIEAETWVAEKTGVTL